jgi:hypothetical protein
MAKASSSSQETFQPCFSKIGFAAFLYRISAAISASILHSNYGVSSYLLLLYHQFGYEIFNIITIRKIFGTIYSKKKIV